MPCFGVAAEFLLADRRFDQSNRGRYLAANGDADGHRDRDSHAYSGGSHANADAGADGNHSLGRDN